MKSSSSLYPVRVFIVVACAVVVPILAVFDFSWPASPSDSGASVRPVLPSAPRSVPSPSLSPVPVAASAMSSSAPLWSVESAVPSPPTHHGSRIETSAPATMVTPTVAEQTVPPEQGGSEGDTFRQIENRLRRIGAVYYRLETWGTRGELFHFHCQIESPGHETPTQRFEAVDADAEKAMRAVLQQAEAWRLAQPLGG